MALVKKLQLYFCWLNIVFISNNKLSKDHGILHKFVRVILVIVCWYYFSVLRLHVSFFNGLT